MLELVERIPDRAEANLRLLLATGPKRLRLFSLPEFERGVPVAFYATNSTFHQDLVKAIRGVSPRYTNTRP